MHRHALSTFRPMVRGDGAGPFVQYCRQRRSTRAYAASRSREASAAAAPGEVSSLCTCMASAGIAFRSMGPGDRQQSTLIWFRAVAPFLLQRCGSSALLWLTVSSLYLTACFTLHPYALYHQPEETLQCSSSAASSPPSSSSSALHALIRHHVNTKVSAYDPRGIRRKSSSTARGGRLHCHGIGARCSRIPAAHRQRQAS